MNGLLLKDFRRQVPEQLAAGGGVLSFDCTAGACVGRSEGQIAPLHMFRACNWRPAWQDSTTMS